MPDLLTVLSSGFITVILTAILNSWNSDRSYKIEYYKKIVEKRFLAYESIENTMRYMNYLVYDKNLKGSYFIIFSEWEMWENFNKALFESQLQSAWLNSKTQNLLQRTALIVAKISDDIKIQGDNDSLEEAASPYLKDFIEFKRELHTASLIDFQNLHDVDTFFSHSRQHRFLKQIRKTLHLK